MGDAAYLLMLIQGTALVGSVGVFFSKAFDDLPRCRSCGAVFPTAEVVGAFRVRCLEPSDHEREVWSHEPFSPEDCAAHLAVAGTDANAPSATACLFLVKVCGPCNLARAEQHLLAQVGMTWVLTGASRATHGVASLAHEARQRLNSVPPGASIRAQLGQALEALKGRASTQVLS